MPNRNVGVDAHDLRAFLALYTERSVTRAATRLGRTQSALSKQLAKLRDAFGDPLFMLIEQRMQPTPRAEVLEPRVRALVVEWDGLLLESAFAPDRIQQRFVVSTTDEIGDWLVDPLLARFARLSPQATLTLAPLRFDYSRHELEDGRVHAVISVNWSAPPHLKQRLLFSDAFVCVMRKDHPLARAKLDAKAYAAAEHLMVAPLADERGLADGVLAKRGLRRRVRVSIPSFMQAGQLLCGHDLVALLPKRVAERLPERTGLVLRKPPLEMPTIDYFLFWHTRYDAEPAQRFLRQQILALVGPRRVGARSGGSEQ